MNISDAIFFPPELDTDESQWEILENIQPAVNYIRGTAVYRQGEPADKFFYIKKGTVTITTKISKDFTKTLAILHEGRIFGEAALFEKGARASDADATTDCELIVINYDQLVNYFAIYPELAMNMLEYLSKAARMLAAQVDNVAFLRADKRVARFLLNCQKKTARIYFTHEEIARAVGLNRVTVTQTLSQLSSRGLIQTAYHYIHIEDLEALSKFTYSED